jgi:hypothetical protein
MTLLLLVALFLALGVVVMLFLRIFFLQRRNRAAAKLRTVTVDIFQMHTAMRPVTWLAVRTLEAETIRTALPDHDAFFISPRVNGWVIVTGPGLPDPGDDVDACHFFLTALSRELGHVQFFHMEKFSAHHAWVRMDEGCVTRAYAWAGETIWNQGAQTLVETGLDMKCSGYGDDADTGFWRAKERAMANIEKIPLLAARWSLDPAEVRSSLTQ